MQRAWDTALVRHLYDVHCMVVRSPQLVDTSLGAFDQLIRGDVLEFGRQYAEFAEQPRKVLKEALAQIGSDPQTRDEYEANLLPLVYGSFKPHFDEAFASFRDAATRLLDA